MSNVLQTLFNTNHELPDLQVIVILAILAIVAPSVAKYLHQRRSSGSTKTSAASAKPRAQHKKKSAERLNFLRHFPLFIHLIYLLSFRRNTKSPQLSLRAFGVAALSSQEPLNRTTKCPGRCCTASAGAVLWGFNFGSYPGTLRPS